MPIKVFQSTGRATHHRRRRHQLRGQQRRDGHQPQLGLLRRVKHHVVRLGERWTGWLRCWQQRHQDWALFGLRAPAGVYSFVQRMELPKPDDGQRVGRPGVHMRTCSIMTVTTPGRILSTVPNGGYASVTGTSMSAPLMSACVALYQELKRRTRMWWKTPTQRMATTPSSCKTDPTPQLQVLSATFRDTIAGPLMITWLR